MNLATIRILTGLFLFLCLFFSVWPGLQLINRIYPLVFGLPFVMAALTTVFLLIGCVLFILEIFENRAGHRQIENTTQDEN